MKIKYDGNYGRKGIITINHHERCDGCGMIAVCLVVDSSEGEYHPGSICESCCVALFQKHKGIDDSV